MNPDVPKDFISTVLDVPKIVPDNWNTWWDYWNKNSLTMQKINTNHNSTAEQVAGHWTGVQLYDDGTTGSDAWDRHTVPCIDLFPNMFKQLHELPIDIKRIRAVSSNTHFAPHKDSTHDQLNLRVMLFDNNPIKTFYYQTTNNMNSIPQNFPEDSNTWVYWDQNAKHSTLFCKGYFKIILIIMGSWNAERLAPLLDASRLKYKKLVV